MLLLGGSVALQAVVAARIEEGIGITVIAISTILLVLFVHNDLSLDSPVLELYDNPTKLSARKLKSTSSFRISAEPVSLRWIMQLVPF